MADGRGRPVAFTLTPGNVADITMALPLLQAVVPPNPQRRVPWSYDRQLYRNRNRIERLFGHLKNWRRVATRYDRLACNYLAAVAIVSCVVAWT